ncbi:MAG TPA: PBP1A family penicillin-binding protein [Gemmatimonadaceae bacterium]|nr:PBP1A family penicillin-binding protein [Gemmatimonadaceae bacterium]
MPDRAKPSQTTRLTRRIERFMRRHPKAMRIGALSVLFVGFLGIGAAAASWTLVCRAGRCPAVDVLERYTPRQTSKLYAADGRFVAELGIERRTLIQLQDIPQVVVDAFVVVEDKRFFHHHGIDWLRIPGSVYRNILAGEFAQGFSTITMQLARNIFPEHLSREKTIVRKIKEARVAREIEDQFDKQKILELYLNQINLGSGAYGVETAAQRYFGKSVRDVNLAEAATLAALPKAPGRYNPRRHPERAIQRRNTIIALMRRQGVVTDEQASLARANPLQLARRSESGEIAPYFVEWVRQQLDDRFGARLYEQGLKVYTTLDLDAQSAAERALESQLRAVEGGKYGAFKHITYEQFVARSASGEETDGNSPYLQGAFIAIDPRTGAVRALVGGRDFDDSKFNRATQALRQPGSTFKPIVYSAALEAGFTAASLIDDAPVTVPQLSGTPWTPQNYDLKFQGPMTVRRGLYLSRNIIAIRTGMQVGEANVIRLARKFGITTPIPPFPSIFIGSADVYPIEMVGSYTTFANLGRHTTPNAIVRVENQRGEVIWEPKPKTVTALTSAEAWLMVDMMKDVVQRGTAYGAVWAQGFRFPAGGKTGTTNDGADVWFIGYTADMVAGVWMGFDQPKKIKSNAQGGLLAAPAWTAFMKEIYQRKPQPPDWPMPDGIVPLEIDGTSGLLASPFCPADKAYTEYFLYGTEPLNQCFENVMRITPADSGRPPAIKPATKDSIINPFKIPD